MENDFTEEIDRLSKILENDPNNIELHMQRGKLYHQTGEFHAAMNDFLTILEIQPGHTEAREFLDFLQEILAFRFKDIYNP